MRNLNARVRTAVRHFWQVRNTQSLRQGSRTGTRDAGLRTAVTGGKHLDGFVELCHDLIVDAGLPTADIYWRTRKELPGYFRAEKSWDLVAVADGHLLAAVEFKAQVGPSFGNNFNNRTEEALGTATDLWAAYCEGKFAPSHRPWLGFVFLLEDCPASRRAVRVQQPHFTVFNEFIGASYAERYELLLLRLVRQRLYDSACLLTAKEQDAPSGKFQTPNPELGTIAFATALTAHISAFVGMRSATEKKTRMV